MESTLREIARQAARKAFDGADTFDQFDQIADAVAVAVLQALQTDELLHVVALNHKVQPLAKVTNCSLFGALHRALAEFAPPPPPECDGCITQTHCLKAGTCLAEADAAALSSLSGVEAARQGETTEDG